MKMRSASELHTRIKYYTAVVPVSIECLTGKPLECIEAQAGVLNHHRSTHFLGSESTFVCCDVFWLPLHARARTHTHAHGNQFN